MISTTVQAVLSLELDQDITHLVPPGPASNNQHQQSRGGPRTALINRGTREEQSLLEIFQRNLLSLGAKGSPFTFPNLNRDQGQVQNLGKCNTPNARTISLMDKSDIVNNTHPEVMSISQNAKHFTRV